MLDSGTLLSISEQSCPDYIRQLYCQQTDSPPYLGKLQQLDADLILQA